MIGFSVLGLVVAREASGRNMLHPKNQRLANSKAQPGIGLVPRHGADTDLVARRGRATSDRFLSRRAILLLFLTFTFLAWTLLFWVIGTR